MGSCGGLISAYSTRENAGIAQLVEQLICNQQVVGSNPTAGSPLKSRVSLKIFANCLDTFLIPGPRKTVAPAGSFFWWPAFFYRRTSRFY